jgi:hypothetical protein
VVVVRDSEHAHRLRRVLIAVGVLVSLLVADGAYAGLAFRSRFKGAACDLKQATDLVSELKIDEATARLEDSMDGSRASRGLLGHPAVRLASLVPWARENVSALRELTHVAEEASLAGLAGTRAAAGMGLSEEGSLATLYSEGRVRFEGVEEGSEALRGALGHLGRAEDHLDRAKGAPLGQVRSAVSGARRIVERALEDLGHAEGLLSALPGILGQRGERRYFLAFHAPSEARGGGGLIGVYGLLEASGGRLELAHVGPIRDLVPKLRRAVTAPEWFRELYENLDGLEGWREANQSPNFPVVSEVLLRMYEASTGERLDGVIAMDPLVLQEMTRATGPIKAPGFDEPVGPDNAGQILMRDIYLGFERREDEQNRFLKKLVDRLYAKLASGDVDGQELADAIGESIRTRHLKMYSTVAPEQAALRESGVAGDPEIFGPNVQMLFHNNFAANKIDWYLQRTQDVTMAIQPDGSARVVTTLELDNGAPRGQKSLLKKSDVNEYPAGLNVLSAHFMLPETARLESYYLDDREANYFEGFEAGRYPVAWSPLQIPVRDTASVSVAYVVPELVSLDESRRFRFTFIPQALVRPDIFELEIFAPDGYVIGRDEPGAPMSSSLQISGLLKAPKELELRVLPAGAEPPSETDLDGTCS